MATGNIYQYSIKVASESNSSDPYNSVIYLHTAVGTAFLYFIPNGNPLPNNNIRVQHGRNTYNVYYHNSFLPVIIDILRNEKPIYFFFDEPSKYAGVRTSKEPVGEEES